ncbi:hypothetical protein NJ76_29940 [Rhodococcus sp. IITR03]|nr:hypothetical protein NJ76_29940 [Rhodococcus sp. IITR03]
MSLAGKWIAVDLIGSKLGNDIFVHSAAGERVARPLHRAKALGLDKIGEMVVRAVVTAAMEERAIPKVEGLHVEAHQVDASDGTPVGLIVWVGQQKPTPRPTYNTWVLDMAVMTTRTNGDDPSLIGDGREADEERHVQYLFTYLNPEDAWNMVGGYYDALTGEDGMLIESYWSLRPGGTWVHFWSSCRLRVRENNQRFLYGLTLQLDKREMLEANISSLVRYSNATLLLVEARQRIPITTVGKLAPLGEQKITQVLEQVNLAELAKADVPEDAEQKIEIDGTPFLATSFPLHSARERHGDPVAIILLVEDQTS